MKSDQTKSKEFIHYLKKEDNTKYGVLMCWYEGDQMFVGFSICNEDAGDRFNKKLGKEIARGRARKYIDREYSETDSVTVPPSASSEPVVYIPEKIIDDFYYFIRWIKTKFEDKNLPYWCGYFIDVVFKYC